MKPLKECTPDEVAERVMAEMKTATVEELIGALFAVSCLAATDEISRRKIIRLLSGRLVLHTMRPEYVKE